MAERTEESPVPRPGRRRRVVKWIAIISLAAGCVWFAAWFFERSLNSHQRQRSMQSWLDERLNADVSLMREMRVRLNLLRSSRLAVSGLEIEQPNVVFPGKFAIVRQVNAWASPLSLLGLTSERLRLRIDGLKLVIEENESREWNTTGLFAPIAPADESFPFPAPKISGWSIRLNDSVLSLRRRGYELALALDLEMASAGANRVILQPAVIPFTLRRESALKEYKGEISSASASFRIAGIPGPNMKLIPEHCEFKIDNLPLAALPFLAQSLPADDLPGNFHGMIRLEDNPEAGMTAVCEGEIRDASLAIFGLPRSAPIRLVWPLGDLRDRVATIRLGPAGYGGFDFRIPFDSQGSPKLLEIHGDVAALSDVPVLLNNHLSWVEWISRAFPAVEWKAGTWLGFGWSGENLSLTLSRSTAGMNIFGEAEMLGGRVRVAMNPGQGDGVVTVAAERLDPQQFSAKMAQFLAPNWQAALSGQYTNLTWRGYLPGDSRAGDWTSTVVISRPRIDCANSGLWWLGVKGIPEAVAEAVRNRGGVPARLDELAAAVELAPEQISAVSAGDDRGLNIEFLSHGGFLGEFGGEIGIGGDGNRRGRLTLVGPSELLSSAAADDPEFGRILEMLAATQGGLTVTFAEDGTGGVAFHYRFLDDARRLAGELRAAARGTE